MNGFYKQFKLTNGDEVICELVESADDEGADVIVRKAMKVVVADDLESGVRYYTLKPWVSFQDETSDLICLNSIHIIGEATPSETILLHYAAALQESDKYNAVRRAGLTLKEIEEKMKELTEEQMDEFLDQKYAELKAGVEIEKDSDSPNVILFKPKNNNYH